MSTPHIESKKEEIAPYVLMPGDPLRAKYIADNFLEDVKMVNRVRNMFAYTGTWATNGKNGWLPKFQINEEPLTPAQQAALDQATLTAQQAALAAQQAAMTQGAASQEALQTAMSLPDIPAPDGYDKGSAVVVGGAEGTVIANWVYNDKEKSHCNIRTSHIFQNKSLI